MKWRIIAPAFGGFYRAAGYLKSNSKASLSLTYICAKEKYSELNFNQYIVVSPCRTICTVCGSPPCPDLNLIHYNSMDSARLTPLWNSHTLQ